MTLRAGGNHPIMSNYISPYYCIATSGTTRDGRVIKPEWLLSAAETYDPEEAEALLWYEHSRWYNPGGAVVDCKTVELADKRVQLLARIKPTAALMYEAEQQEVPYLFSVELRMIEDGRYYLDGLAYTHDPASKAVDKMEFSKQRPDVVLGEAESVEKLEFTAKGFLSKLFSRTPPKPPARRDLTDTTTETDHFSQETDDMTPEQDAALKLIEAFAKQAGEDMKEIKTELAAAKQANVELKQANADLKAEFAKLDAAQKETHTIVEEIGNASTGRFQRRQATGGSATKSFKDFGMED